MKTSPCTDNFYQEFKAALLGAIEHFPDPRTGQNTRYSMTDAALGAFSVFATQSPSFLDYQKRMAVAKGKSNAHSLFGMKDIPCDNQIRSLLDGADPSLLAPVFDKALEILKDSPQWQRFQDFEGTYLLCLDGTQYFSSEKISCEKCSVRKTSKGTIYSHSMITPVFVAPGVSEVISLMPQFVTPQDGHEKQDCENAAAKRWLKKYGPRYSSLGVTVMGDDLYCNQPLCKLMGQQGFHYILVCKPKSHKHLYEWIEGLEELQEVEKVVIKRRKGKNRHVETYRFANKVPLRGSEDAIEVNWCELTVSKEDGSVVFRNAWVSDHALTKKNVEGFAKAARARWKIENENNNVLKTKGYNLEHNFGHGKQNLAAVLATMNLLAFLFHTLLDMLDKKYRLIRNKIGSRRSFFNDFQALLRYFYFESWEKLFDFMMEGLEIRE